MARPIPKKKSASKISPKSIVRKKGAEQKKLMKAKPRELRERGWMIAGFDTSMSSIAGAAIGWDNGLHRFVGPEFILIRWSKEDEYLDRLCEAAKAHDLVQELQYSLKLVINCDDVYIAQEEPVPMRLFGKGTSAFLKQQCEISGAFLGGLMRYGYTNLTQMNSQTWRGQVANDLGITTHHSKWKSPELAAQFNCKPADSGKFRSKQWGLGINHGLIGWSAFENEIPDWPDIIESSTQGKIPRPENSKAKAVQPDDRYDALAIMWAHALELRENVERITW